eukprot:scaffold11241_cov148-Skeletonema_marinoi.AAC.9
MQAAASAASADGVPMHQAPEGAVKLEEDSTDIEGNAKEETSEDRKEKRGGEEQAAAPSLLPGINNVPLGGNSVALNQMLAGMNNPPSQVISLRTSEKSSSLSDSVGEEQKKQPLRRGKWTPEEEAYANRLIQEFKAGLLPLTDGTTLRTFLSKLLNCDPMRISKKFVGSNCIGKQVFRRRGADVNNLTPDQVQQTRLELSELEKKFLDRVSRSKSSKSSSSRSKSAGGMSGAGVGGAMNRSAAAAGRALLQPNKPPAQAGGAGGLLAQLQTRQPGMFDNSTAGPYLANAGGGNQGGLGLANSASINNLMMQTGLSRDQIAQLASTQMTSSASLANLLGKQRSFDGLMSLDFQSMQSIDNLASLIQAGMPNQVPKAEMRNMDWGSQGVTNQMPAASGLQGSSLNNLATAANLQGSLNNLVRTLSGNRNASGGSRGSGNGGLGVAQGSLSANQANANFGNLMPNNNLLQQQSFNPNANLGNLLQMGNNIGNNGGGNGSGELQSFLQNLQNSNNNNNAGNAANFGQNANFNPLSQQLNNPLMQQLNNNGGNPFMAMAQQHQQQQLLGGMQLQQQNGLGALGGMGNVGGMNSMGGNFNLGGGNMGGNLGVGNFNQNQNTANLLQQLLAQQQMSSQNQGGGMAGNKRSLDDAAEDGGPSKKASV